MAINVPNPNTPVYPETAPPAGGNRLPSDTRSDSTDRQSRSLVRDLPLGPLRPANAK